MFSLADQIFFHFFSLSVPHRPFFRRTPIPWNLNLTNKRIPMYSMNSVVQMGHPSTCARPCAGTLRTLHVGLDNHIWVGVFGGIPRSCKQYLRQRGIAFLFVRSISSKFFQSPFFPTKFSFEILPTASFSRGFYGLQLPPQSPKH